LIKPTSILWVKELIFWNWRLNYAFNS
jgi:hypothetical protein